MPELPEVEVVRAGLEPAVAGAVVTAVEVFDERSLRRHAGPSEDFVDRLTGRRILATARRGKFLWLPLEPDGPHRADEALLVHLGMSGQLLLQTGDARARHTRIRIGLAHPLHGPVRLDFADQRIFGSMAVDALVAAVDVPGQTLPSQVAHIARDPLDDRFDETAFLDALGRRDSGVKRVLLDQTLISGIGNIYADEALWAAGVHYEHPASALDRGSALALLAEVRAVLHRALGEGGTSFDEHYVDVNGASGHFSRSLNVYGRQGEPCSRCGSAIVRERFMNRSSHFCPACQPHP